MNEKDLIKPFDDDNCVICKDESGVWDKITFPYKFIQ